MVLSSLVEFVDKTKSTSNLIFVIKSFFLPWGTGAG